MYHITGRIEGVAPILFNHWTDASREGLNGATGGGRFTNDERMAEAMLKVYTNAQGVMVMPGQNFKQCIIQGAAKANLKEGRAGMGSFLLATMFAEGELSFGKTVPDFIHEATGRRPPRKGGAVLIKRPALEAGWELPFRLLVVDDRRNADHIKRALEEAGMLVGLGDWRPEYGRFIIREWEKIAD